MNLLITSAGQRVSLVKSFMIELQQIDATGKVFTTDMNPALAPACHISDKAFQVPAVMADDYIPTIIQLCVDNQINLIIPTIDTELLVLSQNIDTFAEKGIQVAISDLSLIEQCRDKRRTNQLFLNNGINIPKQYDVNALQYPVFVKPYDGSLSKGIFLAKSAEDIKPEHLDNEKLMYMEYISSDDYDEFTVDCYYDKQSNLKCVVPRQRLFVRAGEVNKAITKKNVIVDYFFEHISYLAGAKGCLTIQVFLDKANQSTIKGIEINPRFGGGYPLTYLSKANYSKWLLEEYLLNKEIAVFKDWEENLLMLRYDAEVLVHDHT